MGVVVGLDIGGSTTKIVGLHGDDIFYKSIIKADNPVTSAFGALGKLINDNDLSLREIDRINMTGVGSQFSEQNMLGIPTYEIKEFIASGLGGLYLSGLDEAVVVSMGTGTAYLYATNNSVHHIIGSGVGGGTIVGLGNSMVGYSDALKLSEVATLGDISKVDLTIGDISNAEIPGLPMSTTASNFGKAADDLDKEDKVAGLFNMVYQSIGTMSVLSSKVVNVKDIVFTGQLSVLKECRFTMKAFSDLYNVNMVIPDNSEYATAIGACLAGQREIELK